MRLFHDEEDGPAEPVRGMPDKLPEGESILWQGRPSATALAFGAFRLRWVLGYFVVMTVFRLANLSATGAESGALTNVVSSSLMFAMVAVALILGLSYAMSRAAIFTITNHRVVLRYGAAIRKYVNVPFSKMASAQLKRKSPRIGDISFQLSGPGQPPYLHLWPFARPFKFSKPQPMMRGIKDPQEVAEILARAVHDHAPEAVQLELDQASENERPDLAPAAGVPAT
ncbi:MAG: photosynthetic complex putative assembly protein PuhB [Hyphomonadaceae bacterium]|nr:photosynthetic complex putative assembly protein PuhB [Hyphomonadaceae bacterium]